MEESRETVLFAIRQTVFGSHPFGFSPILSVILPPFIQMSDTETAADSKKVSVPTFVSPIAKPLAGKSLEKKVLKVVKKGRIALDLWVRFLTLCVAAKAKCTRRGVKEVVKSIRKNEKGFAFGFCG